MRVAITQVANGYIVEEQEAPNRPPITNVYLLWNDVITRLRQLNPTEVLTGGIISQ